MRLIFKTIWDALLMAPLVIWLQPPWYAAMSIGALVAMLTAAAFKEGA